ncbi:ABC transporter ATP-binding protein [Curtobacterium sp. 22159]|uniref:ABC transporter ATP-binding protein n=1 Tax=Curtobacterium sp. 22159 TaxID=3453882 RepID=UPI003F844302
MSDEHRTAALPEVAVDRVGVVAGDVTLLAPTTTHVDAGEVLVVRGHNGAGKSTLLKVLAGVRAPSSGSVTIGGAPVSRRDRMFRRRVSALLGAPPTAPDLTVEDHVRMVAATWFDDRGAAEQSAAAALGELGLEGLLRRFPHELSSGQQQLFTLALSLARPFDVLILDEPEQRLDAEHVERVGETLDRRRSAGVAVVIATHSQALTSQLADRELDLDRRP